MHLSVEANRSIWFACFAEQLITRLQQLQPDPKHDKHLNELIEQDYNQEYENE